MDSCPLDYGPSHAEVKRALFSDAQLDALRKECDAIKRVDPSSDVYYRMDKYIGNMPQHLVRQLATAGVKWMSRIACRKVTDFQVGDFARSVECDFLGRIERLYDSGDGMIMAEMVGVDNLALMVGGGSYESNLSSDDVQHYCVQDLIFTVRR